jgi:hypothetical protein
MEEDNWIFYWILGRLLIDITQKNNPVLRLETEPSILGYIFYQFFGDPDRL